MKIKNATNFYEIWYVGVFEVTDYESESQIKKFIIADKN